MIIDRLPSGVQLANRHGLSDGNCALYGKEEDATHIFFSCSLAKFAWSVMRTVLGRNWCPTNSAQFYAILPHFSGHPHRLLWVLFVTQSWDLWHIRNKCFIKAKLIKHPADIIFKTFFLQLWTHTLKSQDRRAQDGRSVNSRSSTWQAVSSSLQALPPWLSCIRSTSSLAKQPKHCFNYSYVEQRRLFYLKKT